MEECIGLSIEVIIMSLVKINLIGLSIYVLQNNTEECMRFSIELIIMCLVKINLIGLSICAAKQHGGVYIILHRADYYES